MSLTESGRRRGGLLFNRRCPFLYSFVNHELSGDLFFLTTDNRPLTTVLRHPDRSHRFGAQWRACPERSRRGPALRGFQGWKSGALAPRPAPLLFVCHPSRLRCGSAGDPLFNRPSPPLYTFVMTSAAGDLLSLRTATMHAPHPRPARGQRKAHTF
jgi:hypothetical protein